MVTLMKVKLYTFLKNHEFMLRFLKFPQNSPSLYNGDIQTILSCQFIWCMAEKHRPKITPAFNVFTAHLCLSAPVNFPHYLWSKHAIDCSTISKLFMQLLFLNFSPKKVLENSIVGHKSKFMKNRNIYYVMIFYQQYASTQFVSNYSNLLLHQDLSQMEKQITNIDSCF